ncbi:hypothetical protein QEH38_gp68 [Mycobacterium phage LilSpotty]|uniref:Uncharacterized protein n=1 Tax=Mycobacterium phage LilSpotty TaxID=2588512 RepID=A0A4Y6EM72_9CAUD|nr:hypothetical protein QEH38_gp68 [Mycobacterium phage LilSpotty]AUX82000.1 hypothetical protein SEA_FRANKIE_74 [Mycobacterium phage Frankie]QDF19800.1 hypothetical protein SEA_LILSPOTTY_68 [Mycobacterium phage LilSpotty]
MNATDDGLEPLGEAPEVPAATVQLAERQTAGITAVRVLHRPTRYEYRGAPQYDCCHACSLMAAPRYVGYPCPTIRAIDEAGA